MSHSSQMRGFTLVELLVVVAIIAVLVMMLMPSLNQVQSQARSSMCQSNLHHLTSALRSVQYYTNVNYTKSGLDLRRSIKQFVAMSDWPGQAYAQMPAADAFHCPELQTPGQNVGSLSSLRFHSTYIGELWTPFAASEYCRVTTGPGYTQYAFEDWTGGDYNFGDGIFRVYDANPMVLEVQTSWDCGATNQLYMNGVEIWHDIRQHKGETLSILQGSTDYGYNVKVNANDVNPSTVVLLDYGTIWANNGEDVGQNAVSASARHRGWVNVLTADGAVVSVRPIELDPFATPNGRVRWAP